jgi:hypothetical protein
LVAVTAISSKDRQAGRSDSPQQIPRRSFQRLELRLGECLSKVPALGHRKVRPHILFGHDHVAPDLARDLPARLAKCFHRLFARNIAEPSHIGVLRDLSNGDDDWRAIRIHGFQVFLICGP